ncbi:MAG: hypothetical protein GY870_06090, partial [archaeon]|nr:hypothetical protein [archaeon]
MSSKQKFIILSSLITLIIIIIYTPIRTGMIETDYMKSLISSSKKIALSLERFEKEKNLKNKNLTKFCKLVKGKFPNIALIIISDKENRELKVGKNNKYIKTNKTFDSIIESFRNDEFKIHENSEFIIRYFNQIKFYLFVKNLKSGKILMIFPYKLSNKLFIVLILEILLIIIISIIITSFIYIKQRKELPLDETPDDRIIDESQEEEKPVSKEIKKEKKKKKSKNISTSTI